MRIFDMPRGALIPLVVLFAGLTSTIGQTGQTRSTPAKSNAAGAVSAGYRIAGTLVSKTDEHLLAGARVTLVEVNQTDKLAFVITKEDGKFAFNNLPAGKFSLTGAKHGFISAAYDQHDQYSTAVVTGAGIDTENLVLRLSPNAIITGKILDESGDPVRHAQIALYAVDHYEGVDEIHQTRGAQTNDLGVYEIANLVPGTYFISATARPWYAAHPHSDGLTRQSQEEQPSSVDRSLDVAYPLTYYADETDPDGATPIPIRGGERMQVDIHLNPVPALHVIFRVPTDNKKGFTVPQLEQPAFDGSTFVQAGGSSLRPDGTVELIGIPAGRYNIRFLAAVHPFQMNGVDIGKDGQQIDASNAETDAVAKVLVRLADGTPPPKQLRISLRPDAHRFSVWKDLDEKQQAEFDQLAPGKYELVAWSPGKRYSIAQLQTDGADFSGHTISITSGSSVSVSVTLVEGQGEVQGTVVRADKGFAGAMVVLVPRNPEGNRDLFRRDQSDLDGSFALHAVVPGRYTLIAIENGWDLDWSQPDVIAAYARHGYVIEVRNQNNRLAEPIEVQAK
jgi:Carboxypeptidase regulatory-like domain